MIERAKVQLILFVLIFVFFSCEKPKEDIIKDVEGNVYHTVVIGSQVWMSENLRTSKYYDGTSVPGFTTLKEDNFSLESYGRLYKWSSAMRGAVSSNSNPGVIQGVCPTDWHLPSESEWKELADYLGGDTVAGGKMKEAGLVHWIEPNSGATNESGFTALPGGRIYSYYHTGFRYSGFWWSSAENSTISAKCISLSAAVAEITFSASDKEAYLSVRCIRDY